MRLSALPASSAGPAGSAAAPGGRPLQAPGAAPAAYEKCAPPCRATATAALSLMVKFPKFELKVGSAGACVPAVGLASMWGCPFFLFVAALGLRRPVYSSASGEKNKRAMAPKAAAKPPRVRGDRRADAEAKAAAVVLKAVYTPFLTAWTGYRSADVAAGRTGEACKLSTCATGCRELLRFLAAVADGFAPPLSLPRGVAARGASAGAALSSMLLSDGLVKGCAAFANAQLQRGLNAASVCRILDSVQR